MAPATEFLASIKPSGNLGRGKTFRLGPAQEKFLKEVAKARRTNESAVLREIVSGAKAQWELLTPAQRKGASDE